jgi:hypothetical protein
VRDAYFALDRSFLPCILLPYQRTMALRRTIIVLFMTASTALAQTCPEIPDNDVEFGEAVGPFPEDVPAGCSEFEVLVGTLFPFSKIQLSR